MMTAERYAEQVSRADTAREAPALRHWRSENMEYRWAGLDFVPSSSTTRLSDGLTIAIPTTEQADAGARATVVGAIETVFHSGRWWRK